MWSWCNIVSSCFLGCCVSTFGFGFVFAFLGYGFCLFPLLGDLVVCDWFGLWCDLLFPAGFCGG